MSIAAYYGECVDCGVSATLWHSGRGLICGPCAIGHMDRADERAGGPPSPTVKAGDVRRLQEALREVDLLLGSINGHRVVERELNARLDELEAELRQAQQEVRAVCPLERRCEMTEQESEWVSVIAQAKRDHETILALRSQLGEARDRAAALEVERDNARECANIRMAELGEEVDQAQAELRQRDAQIADLHTERADLLERLYDAGVKPSVPEPAPVSGGELVTPHVLAWIERQGATVGDVAMLEAIKLVQARDKFGRDKYGQGLQLPDGRDSFEDFVQEIGDALQYGVKVLMEGATPDQLRQMRELTRLLWLLAHTEDLGVA